MFQLELSDGLHVGHLALGDKRLSGSHCLQLCQTPVDTELLFSNVLFTAIVERQSTVGSNLAVAEAIDLGISGHLASTHRYTGSRAGDGFSSSNTGKILWDQQYGGQNFMKNIF